MGYSLRPNDLIHGKFIECYQEHSNPVVGDIITSYHYVKIDQICSIDWLDDDKCRINLINHEQYLIEFNANSVRDLINELVTPSGS